MNRRRLLACLCAFAITSLNALAWDPLGHMLVSQIAYDHLTPGAKERIDEALVRFNAKDDADADYDFVTAACWMDDIRSRPEMKAFAPWHYVNLPFTLEGTPIPDANEGPNVVNGIEKVEALIRGGDNDPAIDRDMATVILLHLVGDIHQPLHTTSRNEDLGGNRVRIGNLKDPLVDLIFTKGGNLHFFWDSSYRRVFKEGYATVFFEAPLYDRAAPVAGHKEALPLVRRHAEAIEKKFPPSIAKEQGDAAAWALESHAVGFELGYGELPKNPGMNPIKLPQAYVTNAQAAAEKRIALAGYRLAALLNTLYGAPPNTGTAN